VQPRLRFGPARRIRRSVEFEAVLRSGRRRQAAGFVFYVMPRASGAARLGLMVSRKHSKLAVERNAWKRCIREAFRLEQMSLGSFDIIVRPPFGVQAEASMIREVRALLTRTVR
jgi:ribonuclease P protein component